ncbi:MAG: hypothetical protein LBE06_08360 [Azoarcus sp.]|nr:hypothetical protein [Azoarcus sp.]
MSAARLPHPAVADHSKPEAAVVNPGTMIHHSSRHFAAPAPGAPAKWRERGS